MNGKKLIAEIVFIIAVSALLGIGVQFPLVKKFIRGELKTGFLSPERYPGISFITRAEAEDLFVGKEAVFVDSRPTKEYSAGHILGAISFPEEEAEKKGLEGRFPYAFEQALVVYCHGGDCQQSLILAKILYDKGYRNLKIYQGGWEEWSGAGLPVDGKNDPE